MEKDLLSLKIDKSLKVAMRKSRHRGSKWMLGGIVLIVALVATRFLFFGVSGNAPEVQTLRVETANAGGGATGNVILNATGYIVAHHKIQVASKVAGRVTWIGVEKGDQVNVNEVIVRLEDDEYRAQLRQAQGSVTAAEARLLELTNGSRPEEIEASRANLDAARAELVNAKASLARIQQLVLAKVGSPQQLDDATARYASQAARVASLEHTYEMVRAGPRKETIMQVQGELTQAQGQVDFYKAQLDNTLIRAPITGTILERNVEKGEFVTTGFVGDHGAKGYVVSMADLRDLQVELDINQADFARLKRRQMCLITIDAYPDRKYEGSIAEIAPEANRQKATVQVKVKVHNPDEFLKPEMNASVAFVDDEGLGPANTRIDMPVMPSIHVPVTAVRDGAVFLVIGGKAVRREVKTAGLTSEGLRIENGLIGGETLIAAPASEIQEGIRVKSRP